MQTGKYHILLADDDEDDRMMFAEALTEQFDNVDFHTVVNGVELIQFMSSRQELPQFIFLDLNMPLKSGMECLEDLNQMKALEAVTLVVYSTSLNPEIMDELYKRGAHHYIQKPTDFDKLKSVIRKALDAAGRKGPQQPPREQFFIQP